MPTPVPVPLAARLGPLLGRAHAEHRAMVVAALAPLGIDPRAYGALAVLIAEGPLSQQQLGARQGIDRTTTVAVIDQLEGLGAVERRRDPRDRRAHALHVTAAGRRLAGRAERVIAAAETTYLAPLSAADAEHLRRSLLTLLEAER